MNNKAKTSKAVAGGVALLAAGVASTTLFVGQLAAETPDSPTVKRNQPASTQHYTGPITPDAAESWLRPLSEYSGPTTPDAAEHWIRWQTRHDARGVA